MSGTAVFFGAHPDDIELTSAGLAASLAATGARVVLVDLTRGELGTRGDVTTRAKEAEAAAKKLQKGQFNFEDFLGQLNMIRKLGPLKKVFMRHAMGTVGELPRLLRGEAL